MVSANITDKKQEEAETQIRELKKTVDYNTIEYPIEVIVDKFSKGIENDSNELFIPDYQREIAWDNKRQSKFIESILLGLPIPYIYVADVAEELEDNDVTGKEDLARWELIDGTQRIRTLERFINNELILQKLDKLDKLEGFQFEDLPLARQRRFKRTSLRIVQLTENTDEETRRDLVERINTGSIQLNEMEKRRGIHRGNFLKLIDELAKEPKFIELCYFSETSIKRKDPQEYILRFFTFLNNYNNFTSQKKLTEFLNKYLIELNKADLKTLEKMKNEFYEMLNFVAKYFPDGFFIQTKKEKKPTTKIKFESLSVGIALALREKPNLQPHSLQLLTSEKFKEYTTSNSSSSKHKVIRRLEFVKNQLLGEEISANGVR
ncbi:DUF262 domain-containing protein [Geminocystis sp. GBBB08]|uniref:DUF262 domain-containing protein n=1 Tax=Geminocystis sp. GBBB08 TaxID=2604140 RepID=UPI0027E2FF39|nr:DUF262 domain-containing protein [Geminocystis sp. GBBB08]MBL1211074.1 DUF262 domain-containing protein [Geminocystis sp. GBBB08]